MIRGIRILAAVFALALLATACADGEVDLEGAVDDVGQAVEDAVDEAEEQLDEAEQDDGGAADADEPADDPGGAVSVPDDAGPLGGSCRAYLRGEIPRLVVELQHQAGAAARGAAVDHLSSTLSNVVDKPGGVEVAGPAEIPGEGRAWTADELRAFASEHRTQRSSEEQTVMHVLSVHGQFEGGGVLGVAINATTFALFSDEIDDLTLDLLGGRDAIERAVLVHEAGHLLCLVNITYDSEIDHEDPEHANHSRHEGSVMHWAIETSAIGQVFSGPPPSEFHPDDLADLEGLREGRY